jgi:thiol-disulfide isomerase/thioredoxin
VSPLIVVAALVSLVAVSTILGLAYRSRDGKIRRARDGQAATAHSVEVVRPEHVDASADQPFGASATLLQFSTEFCARCPATRVLLQKTAGSRAGVQHVDIDLTHRPDLATKYNILQTPTTFLLDADGQLRSRIGGAPRKVDLEAELDRILQETA